jgi:7-keto-8-aminopelargonate synthetase-like enzyme
MGLEHFYRDRILNDTVAREAGFNPYYPQIESGLNDPIIIDGKPYINLASNNYLGLSSDSRLAEAAIEGIRKYGVSMCATPVASGYSDLFREAEDAISGFAGLEASLIFPSCYQANNGLFKVIAGQDDLIVFDRCAHSSLIEGIRSAGCANRPFRHNDLNHLESILKHSEKYNQVFVVTESVFSTEGALAPFSEIYALCLRSGTVPVIDDSHGIGVIGSRGRGILEYAGITDYQGIYTASLGKALAVSGGVVAGKSSLINYMRYFTSHLIYSTAIMPAALKALLCVLQIIDEEFPELSGRLWSYTNRLTEALKSSGYSLTSSQTPINSICPGNSLQTLKMTKALFRKGLLPTPFIYPSVPENSGRIRLITGANLRESSIDEAIRIFNSIKNIFNEMSHDP